MDDVETSGKKIGAGAASSVEEGIYRPLNIKVAIKVIYKKFFFFLKKKMKKKNKRKEKLFLILID